MSAGHVAGLKSDISRGSQSAFSGRPINNEMQEAVPNTVPAPFLRADQCREMMVAAVRVSTAARSRSRGVASRGS